MRRFYFLRFSALFICILLRQVSAQPENAAFRNLTSANGLPSTTVTDVTQDKFGFIWIGSWDGTYRYDGRLFKNISDGEGRYLTPDNKGGVWISFNDRAGYYDPVTDSVTIYEIPDAVRFPSIAVDDSNGVWIGTTSGVMKFDHSTSGFVKDLGQETDYIFNINAHGKGELLFNLRKDVNGGFMYFIGRRDPTGKYTYESFPEDFNNPMPEKLFSESRPFFLRRSKDGVVVIVNPLGWAYKNENQSDWVFKKSQDQKFSLEADDTRLDNNGNIWLNQVNSVSRINILTGSTVTYNYDPRNPGSILPYSLFTGCNMFLDRQGILWITRFSQGISRLNLYENNFGLLKDSSGFPVCDVLSALETKDGSYWIGTRARRNGLVHYSSDGKIIREYGSDGNTPPGRSESGELSYPFVWSLAESGDGSIWAGSGSVTPQTGGLSRIRPGSNQITRFKHDPDDSSSISGYWIGRIRVDGSDRVWLYTNEGLCRIDPATEKITRGLTGSASDSAKNYEPQIITNSGDLIVGKEDHTKAFIIDHKTLQIKPFGISAPSEDQLHYSGQDEAGRFWFITTRGFGYLDSLHNSTEYFHDLQKNNFPANVISGLQSDKEGKIWLSTDSGIFQYDPASGRLKHFEFDRGLQGNNYSFRTNYKGPSGKIYFGGNGGINIFDPESIETNPYPPEMVFTELKLDGKPVKPGINSAIAEPVFIADKIIVNPEVMTISIDFSAIHFAGYESNNYQYKLEGFDKNWVDGGTIGNANYTNLSPGEYILFIKGSNWDGVWSNGQKSIQLVVLPPWWLTWWAYTLYVFGFIGIISGIRKFELNRRQEKEDRRILELENKRKTDELEQARTLQLSMLPKEVPEIPSLDIAVFMKTATEVGGDYYDFYKSEDEVLTAVIGDATGHGLYAGMLVSVTKGLFRNLADQPVVNDIISKFNESIYSLNIQPMYMTLHLLRIKGNTMQVAGAGMPPVLHYKSLSGNVVEIESSGPPLGAFRNIKYEKCDHKLMRDDIIVVMTDGFAERRNYSKQAFGWDRGREILKVVNKSSADQILNALVKASDSWGEGLEQEDDITIIVIKVK